MHLNGPEQPPAYFSEHPAGNARADRAQRLAERALRPAEQHCRLGAGQVDLRAVFVVERLAQFVGRPGGLLADRADQVDRAAHRLLRGRHGQQRFERRSPLALELAVGVGPFEPLGQRHRVQSGMQRVGGVDRGARAPDVGDARQGNRVWPKAGHQRRKARSEHAQALLSVDVQGTGTKTGENGGSPVGAKG